MIIEELPILRFTKVMKESGEKNCLENIKLKVINYDSWTQVFSGKAPSAITHIVEKPR